MKVFAASAVTVTKVAMGLIYDNDSSLDCVGSVKDSSRQAESRGHEHNWTWGSWQARCNMLTLGGQTWDTKGRRLREIKERSSTEKQDGSRRMNRSLVVRVVVEEVQWVFVKFFFSLIDIKIQDEIFSIFNSIHQSQAFEMSPYYYLHQGGHILIVCLSVSRITQKQLKWISMKFGSRILHLL